MDAFMQSLQKGMRDPDPSALSLPKLLSIFVGDDHSLEVLKTFNGPIHWTLKVWVRDSMGEIFQYAYDEHDYTNSFDALCATVDPTSPFPHVVAIFPGHMIGSYVEKKGAQVVQIGEFNLSYDRKGQGAAEDQEITFIRKKGNLYFPSSEAHKNKGKDDCGCCDVSGLKVVLTHDPESKPHKGWHAAFSLKNLRGDNLVASTDHSTHVFVPSPSLGGGGAGGPGVDPDAAHRKRLKERLAAAKAKAAGRRK
jgi:hypothetical protein